MPGFLSRVCPDARELTSVLPIVLLLKRKYNLRTQLAKWPSRMEVSSDCTLLHHHSTVLSALPPPFVPLIHSPQYLSLALLPLLPLLTHFLRRGLSRLHAAPSGPAITLPIKPHVIAELQAMSSILRPGAALAIAGPIVLMVLCHIK